MKYRINRVGFYEVLKKLRLSVIDLSVEIGCSPGYFYHLMNNNIGKSCTKKFKICVERYFSSMGVDLGRNPIFYAENYLNKDHSIKESLGLSSREMT